MRARRESRTSPPTHCAIHSRPTPCGMDMSCAMSSRCLATSASRPRRSTAASPRQLPPLNRRPRASRPTRRAFLQMSQTVSAASMDKIVALAKRRGFVFPGSDIYGGLANTWDYGPLGVELKNNIKQLWWRMFVHRRREIVGLDAGILMHPRVWEASGHVVNFNDPLVDCKTCKARFRADHLIEEKLGKEAAGLTPDQMSEVIRDANMPCPKCGNRTLTDARQFNMMFKTTIGPVSETGVEVYLRPETAQAMFVQFKNVVATSRVKLPFGIAQIGKSFRNEITPGNFIFRDIEFEQMEIEYFVKPGTAGDAFETWVDAMKGWVDA